VSLRLPNLVEISPIKILRFEDIHYGSFDFELWPWPLKINDVLILRCWKSVPNFMKTGLVRFEKEQRAPRTNEGTNKQTNKLMWSQYPLAPMSWNATFCARRYLDETNMLSVQHSTLHFRLYSQLLTSNRLLIFWSSSCTCRSGLLTYHVRQVKVVTPMCFAPIISINGWRYRLVYDGAPTGNGTWGMKWSHVRWR